VDGGAETAGAEATALFVRELVSEDDQTAILRGQLYVELELADVIAKRFPRFSEIAVHVEFARKAAIARDDGIITPGFCVALQALGRLRNSFAHPPMKRSLTTDDEVRFIKQLPRDLHATVNAVISTSESFAPMGRPTRIAIGFLLQVLQTTNRMFDFFSMDHTTDRSSMEKAIQTGCAKMLEIARAAVTTRKSS
jgi:hypothetical protein